MATDVPAKAINAIPALKTNAGPLSGDSWTQRLKDEYRALIAFIKYCKENDDLWFNIKADQSGHIWRGVCWYYYKSLKYEFELVVEIPVTYPQTPPDIKLPPLRDKTIKMYQDAKICMTAHFEPLWVRNAPHFGVAHALAYGLGPWLASEVPNLVENGLIG